MGRNALADYAEAVLLVDAAFVMVHDFIPENKPVVPSDSRFGAAIGSGLFEMILELLFRFKGCSNNGEMISYMGMILQAAQSLVAHHHCSKAIELRHESIATALEQYGDVDSGYSETYLRDTFRTDPYKDIVQMIQSMVNLAGGQGRKPPLRLPCYNCKKPLVKKELKYCTRCHEACYCSRDCQVN